MRDVVGPSSRKPAAALENWPWKTEQGILVAPTDKRTYRTMALKNGLKVLLIHDPKADKAAAAMAVDVGASSDPWDVPGLAHFCEHMLFLGTKKYPVENAYKAYLAKHGGSSNAGTSMSDTTYKFEVGAEHLRGALDIFAQFFVEPLFTPSATEREMNAVDSEDSKNRTNDERRMLQVLKAIAAQSHTYAKYSTGNLKTLRDDVPKTTDTRSELLAFHAKHYHARNMGLALLGRESLDELQEMAETFFSPIKGAAEGQVLGPRASEAAMAEAAAGAVVADDGDVLAQSPWAGKAPSAVSLRPLRDLRQVYVMWPTLPIDQLWRSSPARLVGHLLGHEGPGSLFAALQARGWAHSVNAGCRVNLPDSSLFQVKVSLTEEGEAHWRDVVSLVHRYAALLRSTERSQAERIWRELAAISAIQFRFSQEAPPFNYAASLARRIQLFPPEEVLSAGGVLDAELDWDATSSFLRSSFTPEKAIVWRHSQAVGAEGVEDPPNQAERWYGVPYSFRPVDAATMESWQTAGSSGAGETTATAMAAAALEGQSHVAAAALAGRDEAAAESDEDDELRLPGDNIFIPDDFSLACERAGAEAGAAAAAAAAAVGVEGHVEPLNLLENSELGQLWHTTDHMFKQPRNCMTLLLATPVARAAGAEGSAYLSILLDILNKALAQPTYDARLAGLQWGLGPHQHGVMLEVAGFSQMQARLLLQVLQAVLRPEEAAGGAEKMRQLFENAREAVVRRHKNWSLTRPDSVADHFNRLILEADRPTVDEVLAAAEAATFDGIQDFHARLFRKVFPLCVTVGNSSPEDAQRLFGDVRKALASGGVAPLPEAEFPRTRVAELKEGSAVTFRAAAGSAAEENSALVSWWEVGRRSDELRASLLMLTQIMREPCFTELRTKQQLGYVVASGARSFGRDGLLQGLFIKVLSKTTDPDECRIRVDTFLKNFRATLEAMPEETWREHVESLITKLKEPSKTLDTEFSLLFHEVDTASLRWDRYTTNIQRVRQLNKRDVLRLLDEKILGPQEQQRRMDLMVYGTAHPMPERAERQALPSEGVIELDELSLAAFRAALKEEGMLDSTKTPQEAVRGAGMAESGPQSRL